MRKQWICCILGIALGMGLTVGAAANPDLHSSQPIAGWSDNSWSFMTAWNLSSGLLQVSPNWFSGRQLWTHAAPKNQWIARFTYNQVTGQTAELAWYYSQWFVQ